MQQILEQLSVVAAYKQVLTMLLYVCAFFELFTNILLIYMPLIAISRLDQYLMDLVGLLQMVRPIEWIIFLSTLLAMCVAFKYKMTVVKGFYLLCLYSSIKHISTGSYPRPIILLLLTCTVYFLLVVQNIDSSYYSDSFLKEQNNLCKVYSALLKLTFAILAVVQVSGVLVYSLEVVLSLWILIIRIRNPYFDPVLQKIEVFWKSFMLTQTVACLIAVVNPVYASRIISISLLFSILMAILCVYLYDRVKLNGLTHQLQGNIKFLEQHSLHIIHLLTKPEITNELKIYCSKINRYVEYEHLDRQEVMKQEIRVNNKLKWIVFIYDTIINSVGADQLTFDHYLNFAYVEFYYKRNWIKSIENLRRAQNCQQENSVISEFIRKIKFYCARNYFKTKLTDLAPTTCVPFVEFEQVNQIIENTIKCSELYSTLWEVLNQSQVYIENIIVNTAQLAQQIAIFESKVDTLTFKSRYLTKVLVNFYYLVQCDYTKAVQMSKDYQKKADLIALAPDISEFVSVEIDLESENIGEFLRMGMNSNIIKQHFKDLSRNMHINDLLPEVMRDFHHKSMIGRVYADQQTLSLSPYEKTTYCVIDQKLRLVEIFLRPFYDQDRVAMYGFLKIKKETGTFMMLVQNQTGQILAINQEAQNMFAVDHRREKYIQNTFHIEDFENSKKESKIQGTRRDQYGTSYYQLNRRNRSYLETTHNSLSLIQIVRTQMDSISPLQTLRILMESYLKKESDVMAIERLDLLKISQLKPYFEKKKTIIEQYNNKPTRLKLVLMVGIITIIIALNPVQIYLNNQQLAQQYKVVNTIATESNKQLFTKRMLTHSNFISENLYTNITFTSIDLLNKPDLKAIISVIQSENPLMIPYVNKTNQYNVYINNIVQYKTDSYLLLEEMISKSNVLALISDNSSTSQMEVSNALSFLNQNKPSIINNLNISLLGQFITSMQNEHQVYNAYYFSNIGMILFLLAIIIALVVIQQKQQLQLKELICQTLLSLESTDLLLFREYISEFTEMVKGVKASARQVKDRRNSVFKRVESGLYTQKNDCEFILTEDQFMQTGKSSVRKRNNNENSSDKPQKIMNKGLGCNILLFLVFILFTMAILAMEILITTLEINEVYSPLKIANQYQMINSMGITESDIIFRVSDLYSVSNKSVNSDVLNSIANYINQKQIYLYLDKNYLSYPQLNSFNSLLNQYIYSNVNAYYNGTAYSNMTNMTMQNVLLAFCNQVTNYIATNSTPSSSLLDYAAWMQVTTFQLFYNMSQAFYNGSLTLLSNNYNKSTQYSYVTMIVCIVYLLFALFYIYQVYKMRLQLLGMLDILKQESFVDINQ